MQVCVNFPGGRSCQGIRRENACPIFRRVPASVVHFESRSRVRVCLPRLSVTLATDASKCRARRDCPYDTQTPGTLALSRLSSSIQSRPRPSKRNYSCILPACLHSYPYPIRTSLYTPVTCFAGQLDKMGRWQKSRCGAESLQVACGSVRKPGRMSSADAMQHAAPLVPQKMYLKKVSKPSLRVLRFFRTQTSMTTTTASTWELLTSMSCAATHRLSASAWRVRVQAAGGV